MPISDINIRNVEVRDINVPSWMTNQPRIPSAPPVTVEVGVPVIDIPGCVEAHIENKKGTNDNLIGDDPKGARVFCDGNMPSYNPLDFNEEVELPTPKPIIPPYKAPEVPGIPEIPKDVIPKAEKEVECPPPNAPRIGDVAQNQKERVSGYELQNGICVTLYEDIPCDSTILTSTTSCCDHCWYCYSCNQFCFVSKTTGRLTTQSIQTCNQKSDYKDLKDQGEEGKDRVPKGAPRSSARTLTGDSDVAEDEGREIE